VLVLDFGKPAHPLLRFLYFGYLRLAVPLIGRWLAGSREAYAYILESLDDYPAPQEVSDAMQRLGLEQVQTEYLLAGVMGLSHGRKR
jgi:demethylmenaquinone methyltransferase/2-methoxy-6-polyprenyl-1,4-benzoquinol methylase